MVKSDDKSLEILRQNLSRHYDKLALTLNDLFAVSGQIGHSWTDNKFGDFREAVNKVIGVRETVWDNIQKIQKIIDELLDLNREFNKVRF
jgi:hypothetical protein